MSRWSLLIFRSHVQRSRSNHSFEPSVLSPWYILIPCLLALDRFCFYREDKPEFCTMGGIYVSETFLALKNPYETSWNSNSYKKKMFRVLEAIWLHFNFLFQLSFVNFINFEMYFKIIILFNFIIAFIKKTKKTKDKFSILITCDHCNLTSESRDYLVNFTSSEIN